MAILKFENFSSLRCTYLCTSIFCHKCIHNIFKNIGIHNKIEERSDKVIEHVNDSNGYLLSFDGINVVEFII